MPNSKFHRNFNLLLVLPICCATAILLFYANLNEVLVFILCFFYATLFANPDMDLANQIKLFSVAGIMSLPFKLFYAPFMKHRSKKLSHHFFWGTISRLLALAIFMIFSLIVFYSFQEITTNGLTYQDFPNILKRLLELASIAMVDLYALARKNYSLILYGISGIFIADISHIGLDKLSR